MAALALIAVGAAMHIIQAMAGDAGFRRILVTFAGMACATASFDMATLQRELRLVVIEARLFPPTWLMASRALFAERTAMTIVRTMAAKAFALRLAIFLALRVAATARKTCVFTFKLEIGRTVIKRVAIQSQNIGVAAPVVGMALRAGERRFLIELAVKAAFISDIRCDNIVTARTQFILSLLGKRGVALTAIAFKFRMPFDQLTGHQQGFEINIVGVRERREKAE